MSLIPSFAPVAVNPEPGLASVAQRLEPSPFNFPASLPGIRRYSVSLFNPSRVVLFEFVNESKAKSKRIDLGLEVMAALSDPGVHSVEEISFWCDCHPSGVQVILSKALTKLRHAVKREKLGKVELEDV